ncbi:MAG: hypothetical protein KA254_04005 [Rhodoferax sp.]|nr:hypothetical protein [Rhodoferax sp.]
MLRKAALHREDTGNVYNFGTRLPAMLHLDTPEVGDHVKARIRIEIEQQLREAKDVNSVVLRAGDYFGSGRGSWFDLAIVKSIHKGKVVYPGPMDVAHAWAYLPDFAATFERVATLRRQLHGASSFHFAGHTMTGAQLHAALENVCGRTLRQASLPWGLMKLSAPFSAMTREILEMRYLWQRPHALDGGHSKRGWAMCRTRRWMWRWHKPWLIRCGWKEK